MGIEEHFDANGIIQNVFRNAFLIGVAKKLDLGHIVSFLDKKMEENKVEDQLENKYMGIVFVELLAEEMGVPVGDLLNNDVEYQKRLVADIIALISMEGSVLDIDKAESPEEESYITYLLSGLTVFEKTAEFVETTDDSDSYEEDEKNDYIIELVLNNKEYSMSILTNNLTNSSYFKGQVKVWQETSGIVAEFVDEALEENISFGFKEGVSESELVACVFDDTRTIELMDRFEGFGEKNTKSYERLVVKNGLLYCNYGDPYINLVIERRSDNNITGDITLTEFKKGETLQLRQHIIEELDSDILKAYKDKNQFYRFQTGYLLRAQNSKNRSGYGWRWNWSHGVGEYIRGTEYGETTDYVFVGAYVSSSYLYDPERRSEMLEWDNTPSNSSETYTYETVDDEVAESTESEENRVDESIDVIESNIICESKPVEEIDEEKAKAKDVRIYDVEELRSSGNDTVIEVGSKVKFKKLNTGEEKEEIIDANKILHKKLLGKKQGDLVIDGSKKYLVISINNE